MKKVLSILLAMIMVFSVFQISFTAFAADEKAPIIFVTGIGQTFSHVKADSEENADYFYPYKAEPDGEITYVPCKGGNVKGSNIFIIDVIGSLLNIAKSPRKFIKSVCGIAQLLASIFTGKYVLDDENFATILREVLHLMTVDEKGELPEDVFVPFYDYPVSKYAQYHNEKNPYSPPLHKYSIETQTIKVEVNGKKKNKEAFMDGKVAAQDPKERFYSMVGDSAEVKAYGEDRIFCFNYAPYGSIEKLTDKLDAYIDNVQEKYFPGQKVILVPMSMGATVVSNYLYKYSDKADVEKVISVVGCWQGSDLFADLVEGKYAENSPEIFYTEMWPGMLNGDGWGSLVNILLHCMSKETLTPFFKTAARLASEELILKTPSMLGLIPPERYDAIREKYLTKPGYELALKEADEYHKAQIAVRDTMNKLNKEQGVEFYFIAGYDLGFGEVTPTYSMFRCFKSSPVTNSDEIIQISSTTVGATSVTPGTQFSEEYINKAKAEGKDKYISPEKSVDLSTTIFPDHCFLFKGQKHELEKNEVAIATAVKLAKLDKEDSNYEEIINSIPQYNTEVDNDLDEPSEEDYKASLVTKPLHTILYHFTGPQGIPDLFKK